jgi:hypothetical protein
VEMVTKDTKLAVYLRDSIDKPVDATGFKATGRRRQAIDASR